MIFFFRRINSPCPGCEKAYGFRNVHPLDPNATLFRVSLWWCYKINFAVTRIEDRSGRWKQQVNSESIRIVCWGCNLDWKFVDFWYENIQGKMKCNECKNSVYYFKLWTPNEKKKINILIHSIQNIWHLLFFLFRTKSMQPRYLVTLMLPRVGSTPSCRP